MAVDGVPVRLFERLVHGRVHAWRHALQRHGLADLQQRRPVDDDADVPVRVQRRGHVLGLVRARGDALLGHDAAELRRERRVVVACILHVRVRERRLHGRVHAGRDPLRWQRRADLRFDGPVADLAELPLRVQRRLLRGRLHAGRDAVLGQHATEL